MKKFIKQIAEKIFGKKFRFKVKLPHTCSYYYRFYYSNCFGLFYTKLEKANGEDVMVSKETPQEALEFGRRFKTMKDVQDYNARELAKLQNSAYFVSKRIV